MTVIAFDGTTVAADRQATNCDVKFTTTKLFRWENKVLAISGDQAHAIAVVAWIQAGANPEMFPKSRTPDDDNRSAYIMVFEKGKHPICYENYPIPTVREDRLVAYGSGRDVALGALHAGADARTAVEIASRLDVHCGMGVQVMELYDDAGTAGGAGAETSRALAAAE